MIQIAKDIEILDVPKYTLRINNTEITLPKAHPAENKYYLIWMNYGSRERYSLTFEEYDPGSDRDDYIRTEMFTGELLVAEVCVRTAASTIYPLDVLPIGLVRMIPRTKVTEGGFGVGIS